MDNVVQNIKDQIKDNEILLFMKGSPYQPQCGFSSKVAQILFSYDIEFSLSLIHISEPTRPY